MCTPCPNELWILSQKKLGPGKIAELVKLDCASNPPALISKLTLGGVIANDMCLVTNGDQSLVIIACVETYPPTDFKGIIAFNSQTGEVEWGTNTIENPNGVTADGQGCIFVSVDGKIKLFTLCGEFMGQLCIELIEPRVHSFSRTSSCLVVSHKDRDEAFGRISISFIRISDKAVGSSPGVALDKKLEEPV